MNEKTIITFIANFLVGFAIFIPIYFILEWICENAGIDRFYAGMTFGMLIPPVGKLAQLIAVSIVK